MTLDTSTLKRIALPTYVALLLVLAALGTANQNLYRHQLSLLDQKAALLEEVSRARLSAALVNGPTATATWAAARGMVPMPEGRGAAVVAPEPASLADLPGARLEVRTVWR